MMHEVGRLHLGRKTIFTKSKRPISSDGQLTCQGGGSESMTPRFDEGLLI